MDDERGAIAFTRFTQIGLLRLLTTSAAMDGKPLGMDEAWRVNDGLFTSEVGDVAAVDRQGKGHSTRDSPNRMWQDVFGIFGGGGYVFGHAFIFTRDNRVMTTTEAIDWSTCPGIEIDPNRQSGAPVFAGTRIPVDVVTNNIERGGTPDEIEEILDNFPVTREQIERVLKFLKCQPAQMLR